MVRIEAFVVLGNTAAVVNGNVSYDKERHDIDHHITLMYPQAVWISLEKSPILKISEKRMRNCL